MPYTLDTFSKQVPPALLKQAQALVAAGQVHNLEHLGIEWVADVGAGTGDDEAHSVSIAVGPRGELLATCTCDDEENDLCRHAVAALLAAVKLEPAAVVKSKPAQPTAKAAKKPAKSSAAGRLRAALEATPPAALVELLMTLSKGDKHLQNRIYLEIADVGASMDSFTVALKAALSPRGGVNAWYEVRLAKAAAKQIDTLLDRADQAISEGDVDNAVRMALIVNEQVMVILNKVGDCYPIEDNADRATNIVEQNIARASDSVRNEVFVNLTRVVTNATHSSDHVFALKEMLVTLVNTPEERKRVEPVLMPLESQRSEPGRYDFWDFEMNRHLVLQCQLIRRLDGTQPALEFAQDNIKYYHMRDLLLEDAVERKEWSTVHALASEGLALINNKSRLAGVAIHYQSYLIKVAEAQGQPMTERYRAQFLATQYPKDYKQYKGSVPSDEWPATRAELLDNDALRRETVYTILVEEEAWGELLDWARRRLSHLRDVTLVMEDHGVVLAERYPDEVAEWCLRAVDSGLDRNMLSRDLYREVTHLLMLMKQAGLAAAVTTHVRLLREVYAHRPALLDELKGL